MGLLKKGDPMSWFDALPLVPYVREHGIQQFIIIYNKVKGRENDVLKWGDEIEYQIIKKDKSQRVVKLSLRAKEILDVLISQEDQYWSQVNETAITTSSVQSSSSSSTTTTTTTTTTSTSTTTTTDDHNDTETTTRVSPPFASWKPEYGRFMVEGTPFFPYDGKITSMLTVESNMKKRREMVRQLLKEDETLVTLTMFPLLGAKKSFTDPHYDANGSVAQSLFLPDEIINEHPRFGTLTKNIRLRRGGKVCILVPLFLDENTNRHIGTQIPWDKMHPSRELKIDYFMSQCSPTQYFSPGNANSLGTLYHDSGSHHHHVGSHGGSVGTNDSSLGVVPNGCCSEIAKQTPSIYMDAMGFGMGCCCMQCTFQARDIDEARSLYDHLAVLCPVFLALTAATPVVRGLLADTDVRWNIVSASVDDRTPDEKKRIAKSRYDSVSCYIHDNEEARKYSDLSPEMDDSAYKTLIENGIDDMLAKHIAHLFIRDPLVIFTDAKTVDDENESDHFENIQSTNWQTVRFKPPPPNSTIGWRVEFRVMEVQLTDFENAAFSVFIVLLTRVMLSYNLNFYMPLSLVDTNMATAHKRGAVVNEQFYFRKNILPTADQKHEEAQVELFTIDEILNGSKSKDFVGLIPLMRKFLDELSTVELADRMKLERYISLVSKRASGELQTNATFMRNFVRDHPSYNRDSIVDDEITYDLIKTVEKMSKDENLKNYPELFGDLF